VPPEFVVQRSDNANPPALLLTVERILRKMEHRKQLWNQIGSSTLNNLYERLRVWVQWYLDSQQGAVDGSFRWRGRDENARSELIPKTLTSGLDDYPRPSHPTDSERHVDLRCWIALAARVCFHFYTSVCYFCLSVI